MDHLILLLLEIVADIIILIICITFVVCMFL